jgi:hypothetical protein
MRVYVFVTMYDYQHIGVTAWDYSEAKRAAGLSEDEIAYYGEFETEAEAQMQMGY